MTRLASDRLPVARHNKGLFVLALGGALLLGGCEAKPTGQVAAVVDGDEVTLTELNTELAGANIPENADKKLVQRQMLQRIIERKLLANAARKEAIDQTPEFIVRRQQLEDALLVQLLSQKVARGIKVPTNADTDKFMATNPGMFANRLIYAVDQIRFATPTRDDYLKQLAAAKTMDQVVAVLDGLKIKYERGNVAVDTAQVPAPMLAQIQKVPAGEPFVVPMGNMVAVSLITGSKPAPIGGEQVRPLAANAVRNSELGNALQQRLKAERAKAKIEYQPGFTPPPEPAGAPAAGGTTPK